MSAHTPVLPREGSRASPSLYSFQTRTLNLAPALREALGDPVWASDERYATTHGRLAAREELAAKLGEWTSQHAPRVAMETLQRHGVPAGVLAHGELLMNDPQLAALGYHRPVEQPPIGRIVLEGTPFRGSDLPQTIVGPAPALGEHTRQIARERLGLSEAETEQLLAEGILELPPDLP